MDDLNEKLCLDLVDSLLFTSDCETRNARIPKEINFAIGSFRRDLDEFCKDSKHFPILIQRVGELALLGQYGFVDWINEEYLRSNPEDLCAPEAVDFHEFEEMMLDWLDMMKHDFFDKEISVKDMESAQTSIDELKAVEMWALLTDQWNVTLILEKTKYYIKEMEETLAKVSE